MEETMSDIIGADAAKLAGLLVDLLQKVRSGKIKLEEIEWFSNLSSGAREKLFREHITEVFLPQRPAELLEKFYKVAGANHLHPAAQKVILATQFGAHKGWKTNQDKLDRMALFIRICHLARQISSSTKDPSLWLRKPISVPPFNGLSALDFMLKGHYENLAQTHDYLKIILGIGRTSTV